MVAIAEPAWNDHRIGTVQALRLMPGQPGGMTENLDGVDTVLVAIGRRKLKDGKLHKMGLNRCIRTGKREDPRNNRLFQGELIILNDRVGEEAAAGFVK